MENPFLTCYSTYQNKVTISYLCFLSFHFISFHSPFVIPFLDPFHQLYIFTFPFFNIQTEIKEAGYLIHKLIPPHAAANNPVLQEALANTPNEPGPTATNNNTS